MGYHRTQHSRSTSRRRKIFSILSICLVLTAILTGIVLIREKSLREEAVKEAVSQRQAASEALSEVFVEVNKTSDKKTKAYAEVEDVFETSSQAISDAQSAQEKSQEAQSLADSSMTKASDAKAQAEAAPDQNAKVTALKQAQVAMTAATGAQNSASSVNKVADEVNESAQGSVEYASKMEDAYNKGIEQEKVDLTQVIKAQRDASISMMKALEAKTAKEAQKQASNVAMYSEQTRNFADYLIKRLQEAQSHFDNVIKMDNLELDLTDNLEEILDYQDVIASESTEVNTAVEATSDAVAEAEAQEEAERQTTETASTPQNSSYSGETSGDVLTPSGGVCYFGEHKETYYSQRVLPGGTLDIPGRYTDSLGLVRDQNGYICVAADPDYLSGGSVVETSLGWGKVYDTGCAYGVIDIYTDW